MITGSAALPLPSFLPFLFCFVLFHVRAFLIFSRPDYLRAWNRLSRLTGKGAFRKKFNSYAPVIERCKSRRPNAAACNATILVYALTFLKQLVRALAILCRLDHRYIYRIIAATPGEMRHFFEQTKNLSRI